MLFSEMMLTCVYFLPSQSTLEFGECSEVMKRWADHLCTAQVNQKVRFGTYTSLKRAHTAMIKVGCTEPGSCERMGKGKSEDLQVMVWSEQRNICTVMEGEEPCGQHTF